MNEIEKELLKNDAKILLNQLGTFAKKYGYEYISMYLCDGILSINSDPTEKNYFTAYIDSDGELYMRFGGWLWTT